MNTNLCQLPACLVWRQVEKMVIYFLGVILIVFCVYDLNMEVHKGHWRSYFQLPLSLDRQLRYFLMWQRLNLCKHLRKTEGLHKVCNQNIHAALWHGSERFKPQVYKFWLWIGFVGLARLEVGMRDQG